VKTDGIIGGSMDINKAHFNVTGDDVRISMPIEKVDRERRVVSGWATVASPDEQDDVIDGKASLRAFSNWRGNIREQHSNLAVGKALSFKEDVYYDTNTKQFYDGIYVSAYISKGAQDTWEKVLDGTLTGFSIGGSAKKTETVFDERLNKPVRIIKEYDLHELSLVDNPANQFANILSIQKGVATGMLATALIENVFWCADDDVVQLSTSHTSECPRCDKEMSTIGFVETNDADRAEVVKGMLTKVKEVNSMETDTVESEVVADLEKSVEVEAKIEAETPEDVVAEAVAEAVEGDVEVEDPADPETPEEPEADPAAEVTAVVKSLQSQLTQVITALADTVSTLNAKVDSLQKDISGVQAEVESVKGGINEFGMRVQSVEKDTAFRKSGDIGDVVQFEPVKVQKSLWNGVFLTKSDLFQ